MSIRHLTLKYASAVCLLLGFAPAFALLGTFCLPGMPWHWAALPLLMAVTAVPIGLLPRKWQFAGVPAGVLPALAYALLILPRGGLWLLIPCAAVYALTLAGANRPPFSEWPMSVWFFCAALHALGVILAGPLGLAAAQPFLWPLMLLYVPVLLLMLNRAVLRQETSPVIAQRPPARVRAGNRWLVLGIAGLALVLVNIGAVGRAMAAAATWILRAIGQALAWLMALLARDMATESGPGGGGGDAFPLTEAGEPALFWQIMEKVLIVLAIAAAVAVLGFALVKLFRVARRALSCLMARLRAAMASLGQGAREESESLLDWAELRGEARRRVQSVAKRLRRPPRWADMDNRARVRWAFGSMLRRAPDIPAAATAREALSGQPDGGRLADIYDRARYSDEGIGDAEAAAMRDAAGKR